MTQVDVLWTMIAESHRSLQAVGQLHLRFMALIAGNNEWKAYRNSISNFASSWKSYWNGGGMFGASAQTRSRKRASNACFALPA